MWTEALSEGSGGSYIDVEVTPRSSDQGIRGYDEWRKCIKVAVKAEAKDGRANSELITYLSKLLAVPPKRVSITSGQTSSKKKIFVEGLEMDAIKERFGEALGPE